MRLGVPVSAALVAAAALGLSAAASASGPGTITAMCISAGQTAPCQGGWYTNPVEYYWQASNPPPMQWLDGCQGDTLSAPYTSDTRTVIQCEVVWQDGSRDTVSVPLNVEISDPTATATASRAPDHDGWYNHPLTIAFAGTAFSGIVACTPAFAYAGPDTASRVLTGTCTDSAGKQVTAGLPIRYDATPPRVTFSVAPGDGWVRVRWKATDVAPLASVRITRASGPHHRVRLPGIGAGRAFRDRSVHDGSTYRYAITVTDQAGNTTTDARTVIVGPHLLAPQAGARTKAPPVLTWTPVRGATYYNVQLFRNGKVMSTWPTGTHLRLPRSWAFDGRRYRLRPGRYRWYVWPGFGAPALARYGPLIGTATFVVT